MSVPIQFETTKFFETVSIWGDMKVFGSQINSLGRLGSSGVVFSQSNIFFGVNGLGKSKLLEQISEILRGKGSGDDENQLWFEINPGLITEDTRFPIHKQIFSLNNFRQTNHLDEWSDWNTDDSLLQRISDILVLGIAHEEWPLQANEINIDSSNIEGGLLTAEAPSNKIFSIFTFPELLMKSGTRLDGEFSFEVSNYWKELLACDFPSTSEAERREILNQLCEQMYLSIFPDESWSLYGSIELKSSTHLGNKKFVGTYLKTEVSSTISPGELRKLKLPKLDDQGSEENKNTCESSRLNTLDIASIIKGLRFSEQTVFASSDRLFFPLVGTHRNHFSLGGRKVPFLVLNQFLPALTVADANVDVLDENVTKAISALAHKLEFGFDSDDWVEPDEPQVSPDTFWWYANGELKPSVLLAARWLENAANQVLPTFVSEAHQLQIELLPVDAWTPAARVRTMLSTEKTEGRFSRGISYLNGMKVANSRKYFPVAESGSGIARWVATSLSIAANSMLIERFDVKGTGSTPYEIHLSFGGGGGSSVSTIGDLTNKELLQILFECEIVLDMSSSVLVIDEPEAFLHPGAVKSAARQLENLSSNEENGGAQIFLATHSPEIFNSFPENSSRFEFHEINSRPALGDGSGISAGLVAIRPRALHGSVLDEFLMNVGVTHGDAALLVKKWIFVEGAVDKKILEIWFSDLLNTSGARVVSASGDRNLSLIFDAQLIPSINGDISVLLDGKVKESAFDDKKLANVLSANGLRSTRNALSLSLDDGIKSAGIVSDSRFMSIFTHDQWDTFMQFDLLQIKSFALSKRYQSKWPDDWESWDNVKSQFIEHVETSCDCADFSNPSMKYSKKMEVAHLKRFFDLKTGIWWTLENAEMLARAHRPTKAFSELISRLINEKGITWTEFLSTPEAAIRK